MITLLEHRSPFSYCPCGHMWMAHDIDEYDGDGTDLCCTVGCDQTGCPGRSGKDETPNTEEIN